MNEMKIKPIIISLIIAMIVIIAVGTTLYITTDMFKSSEELFKKYISQNLQNISDIFDISQEEEIIDIMQNNDYTDQSELELKYLENQNDEEEEYILSEYGVTNHSEENAYRNIKITYNDETLSDIELLREEDTYGFRLSNLVKQFVSVKNESVSYFLSSMGYKGEYFAEELNKADISGLFNFSNEEIQSLISTYTKAIFEDIDGKAYSSKKNALITLNNGKSVTTNSHTLTVTKNDLDKIYKRILNTAIEDTIILSKLDELDSKLEEIGIILPEEESIHEKYVNKLQEISDKIEYEGTDERQITFIVYEEKGVTVRTAMKTEENEIIIDLDNTNGKAMSLKTIEMTEEGTDEKIYIVGLNPSSEGNTRTISYTDSTQNMEIEIDTVKDAEQIQIELNCDYSNENISNINIQGKTKIDLTANSAISTKFEEGKNYVLNDYEADRVETILKSLKNIFIESLENSQSKINTKLLNNILIWIDQKEQEQANQEQNNLELQKQRFNNQFTLYAGENLKYAHIQKLLKVVGKNMSEFRAVSGSEIIMVIEDGKENEEMAKQIESKLDDKHTYNVEISHSKDGYINAIKLSIYKEK